MAAADKTLIVIVGPTGSGKTELAVSLAERFAAPVISTDSRQIYRDLPIGTAQPDAAQLQRAEHHFIATHAIDEEFNCGAYEQAALALLDKLFEQHPTVIAVGGSGLYVKALCDGLDDLPEATPEIRKELAQRLRDEGLEPLAEQLRELDPEYYRQVDTKNPARVLRALEVCLSTGQPYSSLRIGEPHERPFRIVMIGTQMERAELYRRIDLRVDKMLDAGLLDEAKLVYDHRQTYRTAAQAIGYKEFFPYFEGTALLDACTEKLKQASRNYAKRQLTWFRHMDGVVWLDASAPDITARAVQLTQEFLAKG